MNAREAARDGGLSLRLLERLRGYSGSPTTIMEVCGTHTVAIARLGLRGLLPDSIRLLSGPGCPVCVTPVGVFDEAIELALEHGVTVATYGDAMRVRGSSATLAEARGEGGDIRVVYSAMDALDIAQREPSRRVVFLGLGFETTSPTVAHVVDLARTRRCLNFSVLSAHKALLPAMEVLTRDPEVSVNAYLCPGHASVVLGTKGYEILSDKYGIPCVVAGFEANDILVAVLAILDQRRRNLGRAENAYPWAVTDEGNPLALRRLESVFERVSAEWRGLGVVPESGYDLRGEYGEFNARQIYLGGIYRIGSEPIGCRCADVLRGRADPDQCPLFAGPCTPDAPVGACMVSSEGACGAHYRYRARPR